MKMKILFCMCTFFYFSNCFCQEDFEKLSYLKYNFSEFADISVLNDGSLIGGLNFKESSYPIFNARQRLLISKLIKFDNNLKELKEVNLNQKDYKSSIIFELKKIDSDRFIVASFCTDSFNTKTRSMISLHLYDGQLTLIDSFYLELGRIEFFTSVSFSDEENGMINIFFNQNFNPNVLREYTNIKFTLDLKSSKFKDAPLITTSTFPVFRTYFCPYEKEEKIIGNVIENQKGFSYASNNINAISFGLKPSLFILNDSVFVASSSIDVNGTKQDNVSGVKIAKLDKFLNVISYYAMYESTVPSQQIDNIFSCLNNSSDAIFICDFDATIISGFPFPVLGHFNVDMVNTKSLKRKWRTTLGNSGQNYRPISIKAMNDGGVVICGGSPYFVGDQVYSYGFITKLDKDGNLIKTVGIDEEKLSYTKSYPNPTNGQFTIEANGMKVNNVKVFGLDGREAMKQEVTNENKIELDLSHLPSALYIYNLYDKEGRIVSSGKVTKE